MQTRKKRIIRGCLRIAILAVAGGVLRVYLKTPDAPGQRAFSRRAASFFLEIRQDSCEKMSCAARKFLAAGHIMSFQIHPRWLSSILFDESARITELLVVVTLGASIGSLSGVVLFPEKA